MWLVRLYLELTVGEQTLGSRIMSHNTGALGTTLRYPRVSINQQVMILILILKRIIILLPEDQMFLQSRKGTLLQELDAKAQRVLKHKNL